MASYTQLYIHYVWSTWERLPLIDLAVEHRLYAAMMTKCQELGCAAIAVGGIADHVHLLVRLATTVSIARLVAEVKGASSHLMNHEVGSASPFKWQNGYGAFTISKRGTPTVRAYILNQKQHHANGELYMELERS
jgi:REP element-mobilizing transposase RayT